MKLTEAQLRHVIRQVLVEDSGGPSQLKTSSQGVIAAINDDNPASFWQAFLGVLEGMAGTVAHAPAADKLERSKFIEAIRPAAKLCNQLRNAYSQQAKDKRTEGVVHEVVEPFDLDLVNKLRAINKELDRVAFSGGEFDGAFEEIAAAHTAISRLVEKLKQKPERPTSKRPVTASRSGTYATAAEGRRRKR